MTKGQEFSQRFDSLEKDVETELRSRIAKSKYKSKHNGCKVIKVSIFNSVELGIIDDELTLFDENGYHYSLYSDCQLTDLIDILNQ